MFNKNLYLTDGGFETTLVFDHEIELNHFAAFELMNSAKGRILMKSYFKPYLAIAKQHGLPFVFESPTWRLNPDWAYRLGYSLREMKALNEQSIQFMRIIAEESGLENSLVSGCIGPRGDGYVSGEEMSSLEASMYHLEQTGTFAHADADLVTAMTLTYSAEGTGIALAAKKFGVPVVISYTLETDGKLPNGESLASAIRRTDEETGGYPVHYMINCAHPSHFLHLFDEPAEWQNRIGGIRANASCKSHAELDNSTELDRGNKDALGGEYGILAEKLKNLRVIGGCCGTDHSHIDSIAAHLSKNGIFA